MTRFQADLLLLLSAAIWGLAFVFQKTAMDHIGALTFIAARASLAAVALAPLAWHEHRSARGAPGLPFLRIAGLAGLAFFVGAALQQWGLLTATVTNTGFLTGLYVILTPLIGWLVLRTAPAAIVWPAVGLAFAGAWMLGGGTLGGFSYGDWLVAACAVFWAAHMLILGHASRFERPVLLTALQFVVVAVLAWVAAFAFETVDLAAIKRAWVDIAYVGLLSSALTFTLLAVALKYTSPAEAAVLVSLETVFAALAGALIMGDRLALIGWVGAGAMLGASLIVQLGPRR